MADGDDLIIGTGNQSDAVTMLDRNGAQTKIAFNVSNSNGSGIHSETIDQNPNSYGVIGESANGIGMLANGQTGLRSRGFQGNGIETESDRGFGLVARSRDRTGVQATGKQIGVEALSLGRDGAAGVRGTATYGIQGFGTEIGVTGSVNTSAGNPTSAFVGVSGHSNSSYGVFGKSTAPTGGKLVAGVAGTSNEAGVFGESPNPTGIGVLGHANFGIGIFGVSQKGDAGLFVGRTAVIGDFVVFGGGKHVALRDSSGTYRGMYAVESPESWLEDFGSAKLVRGRARVRLQADFAQFIAKTNYHVFLTPEGESNGLYVNRKTSAGFEIAEQQNGRSNIRFSYRIVAKRRDLQGHRLEEFKLPKRLPKMTGKIREPRMPEPPPELKALLRGRTRTTKRS